MPQLVDNPRLGAILLPTPRGSEPSVYPKYFGLKEPSFSITPDPQYLFLSGQHREALAHLLYGAGGNGGFVMLTGEVGTGKTTVCRAFLEQLPDDVDVALVLNPAMTAAELLHAICDEFRVQLPPGAPSVKTMLDHLNQFLLDAHARRRRPVLIIDEAQNLRPKVLEQIRLLTNLETAKQKLLQIFLIGQPELRALLASRDLRQLNQRITARYHLKPLSPGETAAYVEHRIAVAGVDRPLFTTQALKRVHRRTGGVPRLINLLCDRALLGAAVSRRLQVTPGIVDAAAREVIDGADPALPPRRSTLGVVAAMIATLALGIWIGASDLPRHLPAQWSAGLAWLNPSAVTAGSSAGGPGPVGAESEAVAGDDPAPRSAEDDDPITAAAAGGAASVSPPDQADPDAAEPAARARAGADVTATAMSLAEAEPGGPASARTVAAAEVESTPGTAQAPVAEPVQETPVKSATQASATDSMPPTSAVQQASQAPSPSGSPDIPGAGEPAESTAVARAPRIGMARVSRVAAVPMLDEGDLGKALVEQSSVVDELLRLWQVETTPGVRYLDCAAVPAFALACERSEGRWSDLRRFDRPAALKLALADEGKGFVVVVGLDEEHALVQREGTAMRVPIAVLDQRWSGDYLLLWRPPPFGVRVIGSGNSSEAVSWLRKRLAQLPGSELPVDPARYDADVASAVRRFQQDHGLASDGVAGPNTLIMLSNVLADLDVPRLSQFR